MRIHLISVGGSIMHNLALTLNKKGHHVTGSDDEIYNPAKDRLQAHGLLPQEMGWDAQRITEEVDLCILGMHARANNPELIKAQELNIPVFSFPEYVYQASKDKRRIVIAGSHGKTTTTSMILHALKECNHPVDFLVGAQLEGFDEMVHLSDAPDLVVEGDEYLSSAVDRRPKFIHYKAHTAVITGVAWDHMNVFKTFEVYKQLFKDLLSSMESGGNVIYYGEDDFIQEVLETRDDLNFIPYQIHPYYIKNGQWYLLDTKEKGYPIQLFGEHNMQNFQAASLVCQEMGLTQLQFLESMTTFKGAAKRMQFISQDVNCIIIQDFAHAPSKVRATTQAVKKAYPDHRLVACSELHTFSSLSKSFLPQYQGALDDAEIGFVFYQDHTLEMKKLPPLDEDFVQSCFKHHGLQIINDSDQLKQSLMDLTDGTPTVFLMMSSGTFGGLELEELREKLCK